MDFAYSDTGLDLQARLRAFMERHVIPRHGEYVAQVRDGRVAVSFMEDLKALARAEGLWNLFLPGLKADEPGTVLSNLDYAPLAESMGWLPWASEVFNCSAPDTGNMEILHMFGTSEQKDRWLKPLLAGEIRSCFAMTEPDVASSDATNIETVIRRAGDDYVINGRKWFITGAASPRCRVAIVMGKTDPDGADRYRQQSMILVPMEAQGLTVTRNIAVMNHHAPEGHCEMVFRDVRVPAANILAGEGEGFAIAQARLGPGRIHHCMRSIGQAELALRLMTERALERKAFGKYLSEQGVVQEKIALSRIEIEQARLLVLKAAWTIDTVGVKAARDQVAMIKVAVPQMLERVADRAIQTFGAMGLSPDTPLADLWTMARVLRLADGPDEVHVRAVARAEIGAVKGRDRIGPLILTPPDRDAERDMRNDG